MVVNAKIDCYLHIFLCICDIPSFFLILSTFLGHVVCLQVFSNYCKYKKKKLHIGRPAQFKAVLFKSYPYVEDRENPSEVLQEFREEKHSRGRQQSRSVFKEPN